MCVRHCNPSQDELAFSFYGRLRHKEPKDHTSEHTALYEELVKCLRWSTKPPKSIEITAAVRPCSPENESYLLWILSGSRRKQSSPRPWIDLSQIHSQDRKQRLSLNWLYKANSRKEEPNTQNTSQKCTGHPNPFKNHCRVGGAEAQQGITRSLTDFPHSHENHSRILPVTCPCSTCFLSCRTAATQPSLPKTAWETYHSTKAMLLSQKDGR